MFLLPSSKYMSIHIGVSFLIFDSSLGVWDSGAISQATLQIAQSWGSNWKSLWLRWKTGFGMVVALELRHAVVQFLVLEASSFAGVTWESVVLIIAAVAAVVCCCMLLKKELCTTRYNPFVLFLWCKIYIVFIYKTWYNMYLEYNTCMIYVCTCLYINSHCFFYPFFCRSRRAFLMWWTKSRMQRLMRRAFRRVRMHSSAFWCQKWMKKGNTAVNEFLSEMKKGQMGQIDNKTTISGSRTLSDLSAIHIDVDHMWGGQKLAQLQIVIHTAQFFEFIAHSSLFRLSPEISGPNESCQGFSRLRWCWW